MFSVGAHPDGHQHGVSIQSLKNRGNISPNIAHMRKITPTGILARVFAYVPSIISKILDIIY